MNKTLYYTITNFCPYAEKCIKLLHQSIQLNNQDNFDFVVMSSQDAPKNFHISTIVDKNPLYDKYVGFLKYSQLIPKNYDNYIYLDSDILYFGELSQLVSAQSDFTITKESFNMDHEWFGFPYAPKEHKDKFNIAKGINAGSFAFKNINFLNDIKSLYTPYITDDSISNAKLEQSSFNYTIALLCDFDLDKYYDISPICSLYSGTAPIEGKLLYHFCNFTNSMQFKYHNMKVLYDTYISSKFHN